MQHQTADAAVAYEHVGAVADNRDGNARTAGGAQGDGNFRRRGHLDQHIRHPADAEGRKARHGRARNDALGGEALLNQGFDQRVHVS